MAFWVQVFETKVLPYGAFVEIKAGVEGLVHISDFSWTKKKVNVAEYVKEGEKVKKSSLIANLLQKPNLGCKFNLI